VAGRQPRGGRGVHVAVSKMAEPPVRVCALPCLSLPPRPLLPAIPSGWLQLKGLRRGRLWLQRGWAPAEALYTGMTQHTGDDGRRDNDSVAQTLALTEGTTLLPHLHSWHSTAAPERERDRTQQWLDAGRLDSAATAAGAATNQVTLPYLHTAEQQVEPSGGGETGTASSMVPSAADAGGMVELWLNGLLTRGHMPHPPDAPPPARAAPPAPAHAHVHATPPSATQLARLPVDAVDRIYRALYVHTVSFQSVMANEVSRMMGDADAVAAAPGHQRQPQPTFDLVATARALQSACSLPDAEAAALAAAGATDATAQGYFYEDMQVLLQSKGQFDRRCEHLQGVVEAERARADGEQAAAAREQAAAAAAEAVAAGVREHAQQLQVRLDDAATALRQAEADAAAERELARQAAREAERAAKATRALEAEKHELHARLDERQQHADELQQQVVAHERMHERMQQELDASNGTLEQAVAAGVETRHELQGAMEERERMVEEARMLRLHLKAAGARNTQLEAEVNKLAREENHWEARFSRQTQEVDKLKQAAEAAEAAMAAQKKHSAQQYAQLEAMRPVCEAHDWAVARQHELQSRLECVRMTAHGERAEAAQLLASQRCVEAALRERLQRDAMERAAAATRSARTGDQLQASRTQLDATRSHLASVREELVHTVEQLAATQATADRAGDEAMALRVATERLQGKLTAAEAEREAAVREAKAARAAEAEGARLVALMRRTSQEEWETLLQDLQWTRTKLDEANEQVQLLRPKAEELTRVQKQLNAALERIAALQGTVERMTDRAKRKDREVGEYKVKAVEAIRSKEVAESKQAILQRSNDELHKLIAEHEAEKAKLVEELQAARDRIAAFEAAERQAEDERRTLEYETNMKNFSRDFIEAKILDLQAQMRVKTEQVVQLHGQLAHAERATASHQRSIDALRALLSRAVELFNEERSTTHGTMEELRAALRALLQKGAVMATDEGGELLSPESVALHEQAQLVLTLLSRAYDAQAVTVALVDDNTRALDHDLATQAAELATAKRELLERLGANVAGARAQQSVTAAQVEAERQRQRAELGQGDVTSAGHAASDDAPDPPFESSERSTATTTAKTAAAAEAEAGPEAHTLPDIVEVMKVFDDGVSGGGEGDSTRETLLHYHHLAETLVEDLATRDRKISELRQTCVKMEQTEARLAAKQAEVDALVVQMRDAETARATERNEVEARLHQAQSALATALGNQRLRERYYKQVMHRLSHVDAKLNAMGGIVPNAAVSKFSQTDAVELWVQNATFRPNGLPTSAHWVPEARELARAHGFRAMPLPRLKAAIKTLYAAKLMADAAALRKLKAPTDLPVFVHEHYTAQYGLPTRVQRLADLLSNVLRYRWLDHEVELFGLSCKMWDENEVLAYPHPQDALTAMAAGTQTEVCVLALPCLLLSHASTPSKRSTRVSGLSATGLRTPHHEEKNSSRRWKRTALATLPFDPVLALCVEGRAGSCTRWGWEPHRLFCRAGMGAKRMRTTPPSSPPSQRQSPSPPAPAPQRPSSQQPAATAC
jgi:chromosome segregation ATPase